MEFIRNHSFKIIEPTYLTFEGTEHLKSYTILEESRDGNTVFSREVQRVITQESGDCISKLRNPEGSQVLRLSKPKSLYERKVIQDISIKASLSTEDFGNLEEAPIVDPVLDQRDCYVGDGVMRNSKIIELNNLKAQNTEKDGQIAQKDEAIRQLNLRVTEIEGRLAQKDTEIANLNTEKEAIPGLTRNAVIQEIRGNLTQNRINIDELRALHVTNLKNLENTINYLVEKLNAEINNIQNNLDPYALSTSSANRNNSVERAKEINTVIEAVNEKISDLEAKFNFMFGGITLARIKTFHEIDTYKLTDYFKIENEGATKEFKDRVNALWLKLENYYTQNELLFEYMYYTQIFMNSIPQ